jgi:hypothetical protein
MMPPPPADYITKTRARSRSDSPEKMKHIPPVKRKGDVHTYGKGKGKEIDSDDEIEVLGSSPGKLTRGDGKPRIIGREKLIVGLEEMWTELYTPKTIVCRPQQGWRMTLTLGRSSTW